MFHRLGVVLITVMFALGLFAGLGSSYASASPASANCHSQTVEHVSAEHPSPSRNCDRGAMQLACPMSGMAFLLPAPAIVQSHIRTVGWNTAPVSGLEGSSLSPEIPPPIASL